MIASQPATPVAKFTPPSDARIQLARKQMLVLVDDVSGLGATAVVMAAQFVERDAVEFLLENTDGAMCVAMPAARLAALQIAPAAHQPSHTTSLGEAVDARMLVTPGVAARDRAATIRLLADPLAQPVDFVSSGHVRPMAARPGGVLERQGLAEAALDLCRSAGLRPAALLCGLGRGRRNVASPAEIFDFVSRHRLRIITVTDLLADRLRSERLVEAVVETPLPVNGYPWRAIGYAESTSAREHMALVLGDVCDTSDVLVCVHSRCLAGDVFGSPRCGCGERLDLAMRMIEAEGRGAVVYLGGDADRGVLHTNRAAGRLQAVGSVTIEPDHEAGFLRGGRDHAVGMQILADLGVARMQLIVTAPAAASSSTEQMRRVATGVPRLASAA